MCDFTDGFKLCTCKDDADAKYVWELRILYKEILAQGRCIFPTQDFGNGLNFEWVKLNLEDHNCFDFKYVPQDGDNLVIYKKDNSRRYISLMYKDGEWQDDFYDGISTFSKIKFEGTIKILT